MSDPVLLTDGPDTGLVSHMRNPIAEQRLMVTFTMNPDGTPAAPLRMETGFWRPNVDTRKVDVLMAAPEGWAEVWTGNIDGAKIELATDAVARTEEALVPYTGGQRLYGQVEGDLLWTFDRATVDAPLQPYMWARLKRS